MAITSVVKSEGYLIIVKDGVTYRRSIVYEDAVCSLPPTGYEEVGVIYVDHANGQLIIQYNGNTLALGAGGVGDMTKAVYDTGNSGVVDDAEDSQKLDGSTKAEVQDHTPKAHTLTSHSTRAHNELTGIGASDHHTEFTTTEHTTIGDSAPHHTKYLNSEAKAAAVLAGAITNGETKAPTHDAVFDVKTTADAALPAASKYTDGEALAAALPFIIALGG